jgi:PAS domain S-box-containing protein
MRVLIVDTIAQEGVASQLIDAFSDVVLILADGHESYQQALSADPVDLVLTEHSLDWTDGLTVLGDVQTHWPGVPVIMVTGTCNEELAVAGFRAGLCDYVHKGNLQMELVPAIRRAIEPAHPNRMWREREEAVHPQLPEIGSVRDSAATGHTAFDRERARLAALVAELTEAKAQIESLARFPDENPSPILRVHRDGTLLYVNGASAPVLSQWQCEVGQMVPEFWREIVERAISEQKPMSLDVSLQNRTFAFLVAPIMHAGYVNLYARDITERKHVEEARRESEERFHLAASSARIGAYSRNLQTGEDHWSPEFLAIYGLGPEDTLRLEDHIPLSVHPDDREWVRAEARAWVSHPDDPDFATEHRIIRPDGEIRWVLIRGHMEFDRQGTPSGIYGIAMDITERKRAEATLQESEQRYRTLFESIDEGFCLIEILFDSEDRPVDYRFLEANPAFERQSGFKIEPGTRMRDIAPNHEQHWFETYGRVARTGEPVRFQNQGEAFDRIWDVYAFRVGEPEQRRVAVLFTDITERKRAEDDLRLYAAELERANQANRILLQEVNHRVNNSLSAILGLIFAEQRRLGKYATAGSSLRTSPCSDELGPYVTALRNLSDRVSSLATAHRLLSANEWHPLAVNELVGAVIEAAAATLSEPDSLELEIIGTAVMVTPEQAHHLALIISELTTNAFKHGFSADGVHICVEIGLVDGDVSLVYRNHGRGYSESVLAGENHSVGLEIVDKLARHSLRGSWAIRNNGGPVTEIRFPAAQSLEASRACPRPLIR